MVARCQVCQNDRMFHAWVALSPGKMCSKLFHKVLMDTGHQLRGSPAFAAPELYHAIVGTLVALCSSSQRPHIEDPLRLTLVHPGARSETRTALHLLYPMLQFARHRGTGGTALSEVWHVKHLKARQIPRGKVIASIAWSLKRILKRIF